MFDLLVFACSQLDNGMSRMNFEMILHILSIFDEATEEGMGFISDVDIPHIFREFQRN